LPTKKEEKWYDREGEKDKWGRGRLGGERGGGKKEPDELYAAEVASI
jgi:hypothetical protein